MGDTVNLPIRFFASLKDATFRASYICFKALFSISYFFKIVGIHPYAICAIGTTVNRVIESSNTTNNMVIPFNGWTNKFMFPPYQFQVANCMVSNFHLPQSTLMMHVASFGGYDLIIKAYKEGIKKKYKFHTFGDSMLILP